MFCCKYNFIHVATMLVLVLFANTVNGIELESRISNNVLTVRVSEINYPKNIIENELNSGLPNNFNVIFSVKNNKEIRFVKNINYQVTFDLWDEVYIIQTTLDNKTTLEEIVDEKSLVIDFINNITFENIGMLAELQQDQGYQLTAQVLVNPVNTERIEKIRRWIAKSQGFSELSEHNQHTRSPRAISKASVGSSASITDTGIGGSARPRFQKLFDQIMEQYMELNETPALWKSELAFGSIHIKNNINAK